MIGSLAWGQNGNPVDLPKSKQTAGSVVRAEPDEKSLQVYPNPSNGVFHLTLSGFKGKRTELRIMNVIGNLVHREILTDLEASHTKTINLSKYANGLYYVKLQADDFSEIRKVIIN